MTVALEKLSLRACSWAGHSRAIAWLRLWHLCFIRYRLSFREWSERD
jgi:hypothetical protein